MCRRSELFLLEILSASRVVFRAFLFPLIFFFTSLAWGQDASTGALRGVVLDAQGAMITNADIVAIRVDTGIRYHSATILRDDSRWICCRRGSIRREPKRKECHRSFRR